MDGDDRKPGSPDDSAYGAADGPISAAPAQPQSVPPFREPREKVVAAIHRFVHSRLDDEGPAFIRRAAIRRMYGRKKPRDDERGRRRPDSENDLLDEIVSATVERALECRSPPWFIVGVPGWVTRLTHRCIYTHFHDREDDLEHIAPGKDPAAVGGSQAFPRTDYGARAHFLAKRLEELFQGDVVREKTFRLMWAHDVDGWTLAELADENGTTVAALSASVYRLRKELAPKITAWDDEDKRRSIIFLLIGLFLAAVFALIWLLREPSVPQPRPILRPVPTVTAAPTPTFDQALPPSPQNAPDTGNSESDDKKKAR